MTSTLALAALGAWSYAGFLAEPAPAASSDWPPEPPAVARKKEPPARPPAPTATPTPTPRPAPAPPAPTVYRLVDARGQVWEHPDPAYLQRFVRDRNFSFTLQDPASRCVNGRCR